MVCLKMLQVLWQIISFFLFSVNGLWFLIPICTLVPPWATPMLTLVIFWSLRSKAMQYSVAPLYHVSPTNKAFWEPLPCGCHFSYSSIDFQNSIFYFSFQKLIFRSHFRISTSNTFCTRKVLQRRLLVWISFSCTPVTFKSKTICSFSWVTIGTLFKCDKPK